MILAPYEYKGLSRYYYRSFRALFNHFFYKMTKYVTQLRNFSSIAENSPVCDTSSGATRGLEIVTGKTYNSCYRGIRPGR